MDKAVELVKAYRESLSPGFPIRTTGIKDFKKIGVRFNATESG